MIRTNINTFYKLKEKTLQQFIKEYDEPHYEARDLYDRKANLKKTNFVLRRTLKDLESKDFPEKVDLEKKINDLRMDITTQIELIRFTKSTDGTSDEKETIFTGVKAVWYDRPFRELINIFYHHDINDFYVTIENMKGDEIRTSWGRVPKNLALQFIQNLRLIVSGGSVERSNRGIFKIHHDLQIAPAHVVIILGELDIKCRPQCVMKKSESEYERGMAPDWLIDLADKPHELNCWEQELTEEEKRVFANVKGSKVTVIRGGCKCGHKKGDHYMNKSCEMCECNTFKLRTDTKETIEIEGRKQIL